MSGWSEQVRDQARLLIEQISFIGGLLSPEDARESSSYQELYSKLESLYIEDMRLAYTRDNSDLVIRLEGLSIEQNPRLSLVASVFENVTQRVTDLTKAILGEGAKGKIASGDIDLVLTGVARGSLVLGLAAQQPNAQEFGNLLSGIDPLHASTRRALQVMEEVAHSVEQAGAKMSSETIAHVVHDPKIRDAALVAVQRISPTGRRGIDAVSLSGRETDRAPARLTMFNRRMIRESLVRPIVKGETLELTGQVREIDLDSRRFDLRNINDDKVSDVRCAYNAVENVTPRELIGAKVKVRGLVERSTDETPRLMALTSIEIIRRNVTADRRIL